MILSETLPKKYTDACDVFIGNIRIPVSEETCDKYFRFMLDGETDPAAIEELRNLEEASERCWVSNQRSLPLSAALLASIHAPIAIAGQKNPAYTTMGTELIETIIHGLVEAFWDGKEETIAAASQAAKAALSAKTSIGSNAADQLIGYLKTQCDLAKSYATDPSPNSSLPPGQWMKTGGRNI